MTKKYEDLVTNMNKEPERTEELDLLPQREKFNENFSPNLTYQAAVMVQLQQQNEKLKEEIK